LFCLGHLLNKLNLAMVIIYIGGYGHSGSTLLEYLMAGSPAVLACGEVVSRLRRGDKRKRCTCGCDADDCAVWGFFGTSRNDVPWTHRALLQELSKSAGNRYSAIVDSSKTAWGLFSRPLRLRHSFGPNFFLVHLVREPRAACWSVLRKKIRKANREGRNRPHYLLQCSWTALSWLMANLSCEVYRLIYPGHYVRVRYEDLSRSPAEVLTKVFETLVPDLTWELHESHENRHQLFGNDVRHRHVGLENVKEDLTWKSDMPPEYSRAVWALSYPLRLRYGYR
jgi:hypothetical protein